MPILTFNTEQKYSHLGGGAWLESLDLWPKNPKTEQPMLPLFTLDNSFFFIQTLNSDDWAVTVFVSVKFDKNENVFNRLFANNFSLSDNTAYAEYGNEFTKVILHKKGSKELIHPDIDYPLFPHTPIGMRNETEAEIQELADRDVDDAPDISRAFLGSCWLQDRICPKPNEAFIFQLNQYDLDDISPQHEGIFGDGMGYLIWHRNIKKFTDFKEVGNFFVQTS